MNIPKIKPNLMDKAIGFFSPETMGNRLRARAQNSFMQGGYPIPGDVSDRAMRGWGVGTNMADADILPGIKRMRAGSRDLFMNTPIPVAILRRFKTNVVGWGLSLQSQIDRKFLGLTDKEAEAWQDNVEREWCYWADSKECDITRTQNFNELQALAFFSVLLSGDCFVALPYVERPGQPYKLRVNILEGDMISNPPYLIETFSCAGGVEVDDNGAPTAYWIRSLPINYGLFTNMANYDSILGTWKRLSVFGAQSGRRNILHMFDKERPSQRRGVPLLAPVLAQIKQISRLTEAELMAALVTAFLTVFLKNTPGNSGMGGFPTQQSILSGVGGLQEKIPGDEVNVEMGYGSIVSLSPGQEPIMVDPKRPNAAFDPFFTAMVKQVSAACELPYELVLLHFSASYSSTRGVMVEAWKKFRERRIWTTANFNQPVYEEWLYEAVLSGRVKAPGFLEDPVIRAAWCGAEWTGPGQGQIDPLKETQAARERIDGKLSTHEKEYSAIHGNDWKGGMNRLAREKDFLEEVGLVDPPVPPPSPVTGKPATPPVVDNSETGSDEEKN